MTERHPVDQVIDALVEQFGGYEKNYVTVIIGVLVDEKSRVKETEEEFDTATDNLLCANGFIKLSGFEPKKEREKE